MSILSKKNRKIFIIISIHSILIMNNLLAYEKQYDIIRLDQSLRTIDVYTLHGNLKQLGKTIQITDFENKTIILIKSPKPRFDWVYEIEIYDEDGQYVGNFYTPKNNIKDKFKSVSSNQVVEDLNELNAETENLGVVNTKCVEGREYTDSGVSQNLDLKENNDHNSQDAGVNFSIKELNCFDNILSKNNDVYKKFYTGINKTLKETNSNLENILGMNLGADVLDDPIARCVHSSIKARGRAFLYKKTVKSKRVVSHSKYRVCSEYDDEVSEDKSKREGPCASPEIVSVITVQLKLAANCIADVYGIKPDELLSEVIPLFNHESHFGINTFSHSYAGGIGQLTGSGIAGAIEHVDRKKDKFLKSDKCAPFKDIIENGWNKDEKTYFCNRITPPKQPKKNIFSSIALYLGNKKRYVPNVEHIGKMLRTKSSKKKKELIKAIEQEMAEAFYNGGQKYPKKALSNLYSDFLTKTDGRGNNISAYQMKTKEEVVEKLRSFIKKEATDMIASSEKTLDPKNTLESIRVCPKGRIKSHSCYKKRSRAILTLYNGNVDDARGTYYQSQKLKERENDREMRSYLKKQEKLALKELKRHKRIRAKYNSAVQMLETSNYARGIDKDLVKLNENSNKNKNQEKVSCGV